jgi:hypothetical protein
MDLITLKRSGSYRLGHEMKKCLISYAMGNAYVPPEFDTKEMQNGYVGKFYQFNIELNEKKPEEAAAIRVLKDVHPGYRCAFVKSLFRSNMTYLPLMIFMSGTGISTSKTDVFYKNAVLVKSKETNRKEVSEENLDEKIENNLTVVQENTSDTKPSEDEFEDEFDSLFNSLSSLK